MERLPSSLSVAGKIHGKLSISLNVFFRVIGDVFVSFECFFSSLCESIV